MAAYCHAAAGAQAASAKAPRAKVVQNERRLVDGVGIEPTTIRLKVECSTTELPVHVHARKFLAPQSGVDIGSTRKFQPSRRNSRRVNPCGGGYCRCDASFVVGRGNRRCKEQRHTCSVDAHLACNHVHRPRLRLGLKGAFDAGLAGNSACLPSSDPCDPRKVCGSHGSSITYAWD